MVIHINTVSIAKYPQICPSLTLTSSILHILYRMVNKRTILLNTNMWAFCVFVDEKGDTDSE